MTNLDACRASTSKRSASCGRRPHSSASVRQGVCDRHECLKKDLKIGDAGRGLFTTDGGRGHGRGRGPVMDAWRAPVVSMVTTIHDKTVLPSRPQLLLTTRLKIPTTASDLTTFTQNARIIRYVSGVGGGATEFIRPRGRSLR